MAWAQYLAALTYALGGGAGPIHAHAHQISAVNNMHHGLSNAIMMIPVMKFIYPAAPERYATMARDVMRMDISNMDRMQAAEAFIERLEAFRNMVGITEEDCKLSKYNLTEEDFKHMTPHAYMDFCNEASVRDIYEEDVMKIYLSAL
jgi:alcohol dehydrogenase